jgi:hypothetical protein
MMFEVVGFLPWRVVGSAQIRQSTVRRRVKPVSRVTSDILVRKGQ